MPNHATALDSYPAPGSAPEASPAPKAPPAPESYPAPESLTIAASILLAARRAGVSHLVCAPGSRNAPFLYAAQEIFPADAIRVCVDERSAGFIALGVGKAGGIAAVITTSGSAVANLHPAVVEADAAGVPLLIISADRPPELRGMGANQTTIQPGIFAGHGGAWGPAAVRAQILIEPGLLSYEHTIRTISGQLRRLRPALLGAPGSVPGGPVHINAGLRDPLWPASTDDLPAIIRDFAALTAGPADAPAGPVEPTDPAGAAPAERESADPAPAHPFGSWTPPRGPRTIVLAGGPIGARQDLRAAAELAAAANWPLVADVDSNLRASEIAQLAASPRHLLTHFSDQIERVILYGRPTLTRIAQQLIARRDVQVIICAEHAAWADPSGGASAVVGRIHPPSEPASAAETDWLQRWRTATQTLQRELPELIEQASPLGDLQRALTGPAVAAQVWHHSRRLLVAASNPVRDLDLVAGAADPRSAYPSRGPRQLWVNRGLAGIDGTISTAAGLAFASGQPIRVLLGDLAFIHDISALCAGEMEVDLHIQIVVVDDGGGSIFAGLEHGRAPLGAEHYRRFFQTPQRLEIATIAAACGWGYRAIDDEDGLVEALREPINEAEIIHVRLPEASAAGPGEGAGERAQLDDAIAELLREAVPADLSESP